MIVPLSSALATVLMLLLVERRTSYCRLDWEDTLSVAFVQVRVRVVAVILDAVITPELPGTAGVVSTTLKLLKTTSAPVVIVMLWPPKGATAPMVMLIVA